MSELERGEFEHLTGRSNGGKDLKTDSLTWPETEDSVPVSSLSKLRLEDIQEVQTPGTSIPTGSKNFSPRNREYDLVHDPRLLNYSSSKLEHPESHDSILRSEFMEWEKKGAGSVWHKTTYSMGSDGLIQRSRPGSDRSFLTFDLRHMDIDQIPLNTEPNPEHPLTYLRFTKYEHDGNEHIWYIKHDVSDVLSDWYAEIKSWKDSWHYSDWKQNLFIQVPRVPVNLERDFDLAKAVASERQLQPHPTGKNNESVTIVFDQEFSSIRDHEIGSRSDLGTLLYGPSNLDIK